MGMPRRLSVRQQKEIVSPTLTALIALRMHRATADHYHDLAGGIMIACRIAELVQRHRHLLPDIHEAMRALNTIFTRWQQRTVDDAYLAATHDEMTALELCVRIYRALLQTTPGKVIRRALLNVTEKANATTSAKTTNYQAGPSLHPAR